MTKLDIVAPPNDIFKRQKVERMIAEYQRETREDLRELEGKGVEFQKWWEES